MKQLITILIILAGLFIIWWISGHRNYCFDANCSYSCSDQPYGVAWRVGHLPELLIEGGCH